MDRRERVAALLDDALDGSDRASVIEQILQLLRETGGSDVSAPAPEGVTEAARGPLRARVLDALAVRAATPTELVDRLGSSREVIARVLKQLLDEAFVAFVSDPADGRKRLYSLTSAGGQQRGLLHAYGAAGRPIAPDDATAHRRIQTAISRAIDHRRKTNRLADVADRLEAALELAERRGFHDLELTIRAELVATYRQLREVGSALPHLMRLRCIAAGEATEVAARFVLLASAHVAYEEGRLGDLLQLAGDACPSTVTLAPRAPAYVRRGLALTQAATEFERCAATQLAPFQFRSRSGWAKLSYAKLLREHASRIEAIEAAEAAKRTFEEFEDEYGSCRAEFLVGFCLRLGGYLPAARRRLSDSLATAQRHGFERFVADTTLQLGDVLRQQGEHDAALEMLREAEARAGQLQMTVTRGFAQSAIAATHVALGSPEEARRQLRAALDTFAPTNHTDGIALTNRRLAALERIDQRRAAARAPLRTAKLQYTSLTSPAGILGCKLEALAISGRAKREALTNDVIAMLPSGSRDRSLIEQDPWTPPLLGQYAREVGDVLLEALANSVTAAAEQRFEENGARLRLTPDERGSYQRRPDPMAGEPMRKFAVRAPVIV